MFRTEKCYMNSFHSLFNLNLFDTIGLLHLKCSILACYAGKSLGYRIKVQLKHSITKQGYHDTVKTNPSFIETSNRIMKIYFIIVSENIVWILWYVTWRREKASWSETISCASRRVSILSTCWNLDWKFFKMDY